MNLAVDIGNSFVKIGAFEGEELVSVHRYNHSQTREIEEFVSQGKFQAGIISSVSRNDDIQLVINKYMPILFMEADLEFPININYATPATLGQDRIAASVAAQYQCPKHKKLVIDAGTCVTYDFIDDQGNYLGGGISPGITMRFNALHNFTGKLPLVEKPTIDSYQLIGNDTESCIISGILNGIKAELKGIIDCYTEQFGEILVFLTGGDRYYFEKTIKSINFADENLVLKGLRIILEKNAKKAI